MKNFKRKSILLIMSMLLSASALFAQPQPGFNYQAVARDGAGKIMAEQDLTIRVLIRAASLDGTVIWQEDHDVMTNNLGLFTLTVGGANAYRQGGKVETFGDIDWSASSFFLNVLVDVDGGFQDLGGAPILTVPISQYSENAKNADFAQTANTAESATAAAGNFSVQGDPPTTGEPLFEVKRSDGSVAFAVYDDMVWVYVEDDGTKGVKGGFAVGGYQSSKGASEEYMRVTRDSVRVYINDDAGSKGIKGGFAVGGYQSSKGPADQFLYVSGKNSVDDDYSIAMGVDAIASGAYSTAIGYNATASGNSSFSAGPNSVANSTNGIAIGNGAISGGLNAASMGFQSQAMGDKSIAIGSYYNYSYTIPYFNYTIPGKSMDGAKGDFIFIPPLITPLFRTVSFNRANIAQGQFSMSIGNGNLSNNGGMALGSNNDALGFGSSAVGVSNRAINTNAFAAGYESMATGYYATAIGNNAYAKPYGSFVIGQYNEISGDSTKWVEEDPLFVVGNGFNDDNRNNAFTIYKNGRSVLKGKHAYFSNNDRRTLFMYNPITFTFTTSTNVYGIRSYINRSDEDVDYYYSGYFYDTGSAGQYGGLYADTRSGDGHDVAEYIYDSEGTTEPGDVLVADITKKESVLVSDKPYQESIVGVVTTDPHLTMGTEIILDEESGTPLDGVNATRLALTGRVPVKVTDENGAIKPGDKLTSSSTPGYAMKWTLLDVSQAADFDELKTMMAENERRRNAVIGKALESHDSGTGSIKVLISIQ